LCTPAVGSSRLQTSQVAETVVLAPLRRCMAASRAHCTHTTHRATLHDPSASEACSQSQQSPRTTTHSMQFKKTQGQRRATHSAPIAVPPRERPQHSCNRGAPLAHWRARGGRCAARTPSAAVSKTWLCAHTTWPRHGPVDAHTLALARHAHHAHASYQRAIPACGGRRRGASTQQGPCASSAKHPYQLGLLGL
jgi:hypothetical protein